MILSYIYNILKFKKWELLFLLTILISLKCSSIIPLKPDVNYLTESHKCPACFGISACNYINKIDITFRDLHSAFSYYFGAKNVFFGTFNGSEVILKKLARSFELNDFDRMICENSHLSSICPTNIEKEDNKIDFHNLIKRQISLPFNEDHFSRLRLCPNVRHLKNLLYPVYINNKNVDPKIFDVNIWTLTVVNPEPLLLQILSADKNWPVPRYLGACGRIAIEEYVGPALTSYYNEPWLRRAKTASSLLDAAHTFTFKSENFSFYLTDVSADNIAVDSKFNARFVDLENVIVVDKNVESAERAPNWKELHVNTDKFSCPECLVFSSAEICGRRVSDHNYYAVCKMLLSLNINNNILPGGLLHDIPADILKQYPNIENLIGQCVSPDVDFTRITAGMELKRLLDVIIQG